MNNEGASSDVSKKSILICDTQPVAVEGLKWLIETSVDLRFAGSLRSLDAVYAVLSPETVQIAAIIPEPEDIAIEGFGLVAAISEAMGAEAALLSGEMPGEIARLPGAEELEPGVEEPGLGVEELAPGVEELAKEAFASDLCAISEALESWAEPARPMAVLAEPLPCIAGPIDAVVVDKGLGFAGVMELLQKLTSSSHSTPVVVWGTSITESEALRLLQAGAKGIVRRTSGSATLLACLRSVTSGGTWMEEGIFGSTEKLFNPRRSQLTTREREVVVLVEKGMRNRDIGKVLGIQTGTVKIHLKHIFEKTGVRGRYGLAFTGLQSKGSIAMAAPHLLATQ